MLLAVTVAAKVYCFNDIFEFARVTAEFATLPHEKLHVIFGATVASLPDVRGSVVVYDGVANAFASRPGDCNDSVGSVVVVATDGDNRHCRISVIRHKIVACVYCRHLPDSVKYFSQKDCGECWQDGKRLGTNSSALIHTHTRTRTVNFQVTTLNHPTHLTSIPWVDVALHNTYCYPATSTNLTLALALCCNAAWHCMHDQYCAGIQCCMHDQYLVLWCSTHDAVQHCCGAASLRQCSTQAPPG